MFKICQVPGCEKKVHGKGYCQFHYDKINKTHSKWYEKLKTDPERFERERQRKKKWAMENRGRKAQNDKAYYQDHKAEILAYKKRWQDKARFSGKREEVIQRDGEKCQHCGLSRELNRIAWNCDLHVHHINGLGRSVLDISLKDNDLENLITLCKSCHVKADVALGKIMPWKHK